MTDTSRLTVALCDAIEQQTQDLCPFDEDTLAELADLLGDDVTPSTLEAALEEVVGLDDAWDSMTLERIASQVCEDLIGVPA